MTGWAGTAVLLVGAYLVTARRRQAFLWSLAGNLLWHLRGWELRAWDVVVETAAFVVLAAVGWFRWRKT